MKKQLFRRIMALVLACSMVMSLACTTAFAMGDVSDDGVEELEVTQVDDEAPAEEDDIVVPEEEEIVAEPEETPAEEETVQPETETEPEVAEPETVAPETVAPETAEPDASAPAVAGEEGLVGDPEVEETGWRAVANENGTVSYQYWYQDAKGNVVQAKDYFGTGSALANSGAYNAYYIKSTFEIKDSSVAGGSIDVGNGYYYFDAQGNCTFKNTWTLYTVTAIDKNNKVTTDAANSGIKCLKMNVRVGSTSIYYGQKVKADRAVTAPNNYTYLANAATSGVYTSISQNQYKWHAERTQEGWAFSSTTKTDGIGVRGTLMSGIYYINIHSGYSKAPNKQYCYKFVKGKPASNLDGKTSIYYNSSQKKYYAVYFADSKKYGVSVGYYAKQGTAWTNFSGKSSKCYVVSSKGKASLYTGIYKRYYYKKGVKTKLKGWKKVRNTAYDSGTAAKIQTLSKKYRGITQPAYAYDYYYFNNSSKCVVGKKKAPAIDSSDSRSYYYYFDKSTGKLIQNLFTYNPAFKAYKMQIICDGKHTNHNTTFLLYNSSTKKYDIAALQVICSTPMNPNGKNGIAYGTYYLSSLSRRSWLQNKSKTMWFCYLTYINTTGNKRTGFFFHSPAYSKQSYKALNSAYNKFGRSNTGGCLRLQTGYCQLVYSISQAQQKKKQYKYVVVKFGNYKTISPFKRVTQKMIQINLKKFKYDPTTPASKL